MKEKSGIGTGNLADKIVSEISRYHSYGYHIIHNGQTSILMLFFSANMFPVAYEELNDRSGLLTVTAGLDYYIRHFESMDLDEKKTSYAVIYVNHSNGANTITKEERLKLYSLALKLRTNKISLPIYISYPIIDNKVRLMMLIGENYYEKEIDYSTF